MEDILDVYKRPLSADEVLVCIDETTKQHIKEIRPPEKIRCGKAGKYDCEYVRNGVSHVFMMSAPHEGWRHVEVKDSHKKEDFADCLKLLADRCFPDRKIILVMDNLNTHNFGSLYKRFSAEEAHRLKKRFEIHYTPKHGSWLDMAEIELSVLSKQCLNRRLPDQEFLKNEIAEWESNRNQESNKINWQFTTKDARIKLKHLYPTF